MSRIAFAGATVYCRPGVLLRDAVVLVDGSSIAAVGTAGDVTVPPGTPQLDCRGHAIASGFWNSHVHFSERKWANAAQIPMAELQRQLQSYARFGFTSVFDLSSSLENTLALRRRIEGGDVPGPRILTTGEGLIPPNGLPEAAVLRVMGFMPSMHPEIDGDERAADAARDVLHRGADAIKIFASGAPSERRRAIPETAIAAATAAAKSAEKPSFGHPNDAADLMRLVAGGIDVVAHTTPASGAWPDNVVDAMLARGVAITPTLTLWEQAMRHDRLSVAEPFVETAVGQLAEWHRSGGCVLFGTDVGAVDVDPSREYALMRAAGMSVSDILAALTIDPSKRFGGSGCIEPGAQADLVVLRGDPQNDLRALSAVRLTMRAGITVYEE